MQTTSLLRPEQVKSMTREKESLQEKLHQPDQNKGQIVRNLQRLSKQLDTQTPKAYVGKDLDAAVRREAQLRQELLDGMPSQEEMRKAPPGAVGKHMRWEKKNKQKVLEWKNLQLRLNASSDDPDIANFERFRPTTSSLNMDNAMIPGKQFFMPTTTGPAVLFTEEQLTLIRQHAPELAERLISMSNDERQQVKDAFTSQPKVEVAPKKKKRPEVSAEERKARSDRMKAMHAAKKAEAEKGE